MAASALPQPDWAALSPGRRLFDLDRVVSTFTNRYKYFSDGVGDPDTVARLDRSIFAARPPAPPRAPYRVLRAGPLTRQETGAWPGSPAVRGARFEERAFESPGAADLPAESGIARYILVLPEKADENTPVCLHLPATGDEGYRRRMLWCALPLLAHGIGSAILETPYYGTRRPSGQTGCFLRGFDDLLKLACYTIQEGRAILHQLRHTEGFHTLGVSGVSMGGNLAAFTAGLMDFPVAAALFIAPHSPHPVFLNGVLRRAVDWSALQNSLEASSRTTRQSRRGSATTTDARQYVSAALSRCDVRRLRPCAPGATIIVGARHDSYVAPASVELLHGAFPGSELRWVSGGHVRAFLGGRHVLTRAIVDAFDRIRRMRPATLKASRTRKKNGKVPRKR